MRRLSVFFLPIVAACIAAAPASARTDKDYTGADAGYIVYAVGTVDGAGIGYNFSYSRMATLDRSPVKDWKGKIEPKLGAQGIYLKVKDPDYVGDEVGHVRVRRLPPGQYAVNGYSFGSYYSTAENPFRLPFTIRTGQATYIGSFARGVSLATPLRKSLKAMGYFVVADRSTRDLPIAEAHLPGVPITSSVTDVNQFDNIMLRTAKP